MTSSSPNTGSRFKSPLRCLCRAFSESRNRWKEKAAKRKSQVEQLQVDLHRAEQRQRQLVARLEEAMQQNEVLRTERNEARAFPDWTAMPRHQFSAEMISLSCLLSNVTGFRAVPKVLQCIATAFDLPLKIPTRDAVRNWSCRNGVAILGESEKADDWIWMIDHSVQLGRMFALVVLAIRKSQLPRSRPLRREDMAPLAVMPSSTRDKQEVSRQLRKVADRTGIPLAILSDGARELHEGAQGLKAAGFEGVHLDDIKHMVANLLKRKLGREPRFQAFMAHVGQTTASIQQTELDHLLPPRKKEKCRFMNFDQLIDWATMVESQLAASGAAASGASERLREKLGWLGEFADDLCGWRECRQLIGQVLRQANHEGVYVGSSDELRNQLEQCPAASRLARDLREELVSLYRCNEAKLSSLKEEHLRLPCSTEVLESAFGGFKAIQGPHGRGTFTSLLAVFATLFDTCTPEKIRERFASTGNTELQAWIQEAGLTNSTQSRRTRAYHGAYVPT